MAVSKEESPEVRYHIHTIMEVWRALQRSLLTPQSAHQVEEILSETQNGILTDQQLAVLTEAHNQLSAKPKFLSGSPPRSNKTGI